MFRCPGILLAPLKGSAPHRNPREKENLWENQHESHQSNANKDTLCLSTRGKKSTSPEHMWKKKRGIFIEFPGSCWFKGRLRWFAGQAYGFPDCFSSAKILLWRPLWHESYALSTISNPTSSFETISLIFQRLFEWGTSGYDRKIKYTAPIRHRPAHR